MTAETLLPWTGRRLTLGEWDAIPHDEQFRLELVEGVLSIMAQPPGLHQRAAKRLGPQLDGALPPELEAALEMEVVLVDGVPPTIRVPDVLITRSALIDTNPRRLTGQDVLVVVEILSEGTRKVDRILKFAEYAEAGIPQYWIIDLDPPASLLAFTLVDGAYERSGEFSGPVEIAVDGHPVAVDPAALPRR